MQFATADEYRKHLRAIIDCQHTVEHAVALKFPLSRPVGNRELRARGDTKPSSDDGDWMDTSVTDRLYRRNMALSNERFVTALHCEINMMQRRNRRMAL